jgi:hypothetical protein
MRQRQHTGGEACAMRSSSPVTQTFKSPGAGALDWRVNGFFASPPVAESAARVSPDCLRKPRRVCSLDISPAPKVAHNPVEGLVW